MPAAAELTRDATAEQNMKAGKSKDTESVHVNKINREVAPHSLPQCQDQLHESTHVAGGEGMRQKTEINAENSRNASEKAVFGRGERA